MHKVCGAVYWVNDPRRLVSQDARLTFCNRLFPNETADRVGREPVLNEAYNVVLGIS